MGLGWVFLIRGYTGSYRIIGWIVSYRRLDRIVSLAGSYRIGWIGLYCIVWIRKHWLLCAVWLMVRWYKWDGWTGWGVGGTGVGRIDVSTDQNESATMGAGTGAPSLALEGRRAMGSSGWHQLRWCCKYTEYLYQRRKIIQIECTQIGTNT